jgi:hypothetical protein
MNRDLLIFLVSCFALFFWLVVAMQFVLGKKPTHTKKGLILLATSLLFAAIMYAQSRLLDMTFVKSKDNYGPPYSLSDGFKVEKKCCGSCAFNRGEEASTCKGVCCQQGQTGKPKVAFEYSNLSDQSWQNPGCIDDASLLYT